ncbi:UNVERIFIED_ORG: hypothetical protein ABRZ91_001787 [Heyndrickxia coagulans]
MKELKKTLLQLSDEIFKKAGEMCKNYVINEGWENVNERIVTALTKLIEKQKFFKEKINVDEISADEHIFIKNFLKEVVVYEFERFANRASTPKQILFYKNLCDDLGIEMKSEGIWTNKEISYKINELLLLKQYRKQKQNSIFKAELKETLDEIDNDYY